MGREPQNEGRTIVSVHLMCQFPSFQSPLAEDDQLNEETFGEGAVGTQRVGYLLVDSDSTTERLLIFLLQRMTGNPLTIPG